nr:hypothetical protein [Tanacetum cinerariifolium]
MLMKGIELSYQERECRFYNLLDKFAHVLGEALYEYYWRFSQLINDMHTIRMTMQQVQVNTKNLNALPSEWSKFVTYVKLAKSFYTTNYDELYVYLNQHERHANEVCISHERYSNSLAFIANSPTLYNPSQFLPSNNQLRTSSNPRNQATIQDGKVKVKQVQGRQHQSYAGTRNRGIANTLKGNVALDPPRVVKSYYCQEEGNMVKVVLMANLSSCNHEVLSKDTNRSAPNDLLVLSLVKQITDHVAYLVRKIKQIKWEKLIDSQMDDLIRNGNAKLTAFQQEIDTLKETLSNNVKEKESLSNMLIVFKTESKEKESKCIDKEIVLEKQNKERENIICKMYRSTQAMHMLMKPQVFYNDTHKQALGYQNPFHLKKAQRIQPTLYDGSVIAKEHAVISVNDDEETLILEEECQSKMIKEDFVKCFVTQKELSAEQAFWLKHLSLSETPITSHTPVRIKSPSELPKCSVDMNIFEIQIKQLRIDNDQLWNQIMSQEIMHIVVNSVDILDVKKSCVNDCRMFKLDVEPISPRLKNNRDAHEVYIENTIEYADTLHRFVERAKT